MTWSQQEWEALIGDTFELCLCGHFKWKHLDNLGECYGVELDDESIRCDCKNYDPERKLRVVK